MLAILKGRYGAQGFYVVPKPEQLAEQRRDEIIYFMNGLEAPSKGYMFSWEEAAANGGGAEAR